MWCSFSLDEAEERYANRDSRPEDLELIEQLRYAVHDKEARIKALNVRTKCSVLIECKILSGLLLTTFS